MRLSPWLDRLPRKIHAGISESRATIQLVAWIVAKQSPKVPLSAERCSFMAGKNEFCAFRVFGLLGGANTSRIAPNHAQHFAQISYFTYDSTSGRKKRLRRRKIDHPPRASKNSADALAGRVCQLSRIPCWQLVGKVENAAYAAAVNRPELGGTITPILIQEFGAVELIRAQRGMPHRSWQRYN